jgi:hypothetical protein
MLIEKINTHPYLNETLDKVHIQIDKLNEKLISLKLKNTFL